MTAMRLPWRRAREEIYVTDDERRDRERIDEFVEELQELAAELHHRNVVLADEVKADEQKRP